MKDVWTFYSPCPAIQVADLCLASCTSEKRVKDISEAAAPPQTVQISGKYESDSANLPKKITLLLLPILSCTLLHWTQHSTLRRQIKEVAIRLTKSWSNCAFCTHVAKPKSHIYILVLDRHRIQSKPIQNERIL